MVEPLYSQVVIFSQLSAKMETNQVLMDAWHHGN